MFIYISKQSLNVENYEYCYRLPAFKHLEMKILEMPEFSAWLQQGTPEQCVPQLWDEKKSLTAIGTAMYELLIIQVYSPFSFPSVSTLVCKFKAHPRKIDFTGI